MYAITSNIAFSDLYIRFIYLMTPVMYFCNMYYRDEFSWCLRDRAGIAKNARVLDPEYQIDTAEFRAVTILSTLCVLTPFSAKMSTNVNVSEGSLSSFAILRMIHLGDTSSHFILCGSLSFLFIS